MNATELFFFLDSSLASAKCSEGSTITFLSLYINQ
jgi:hypothetical protein